MGEIIDVSTEVFVSTTQQHLNWAQSRQRSAHQGLAEIHFSSKHATHTILLVQFLYDSDLKEHIFFKNHTNALFVS